MIINANTIKAKDELLILIAKNGDKIGLDNWLKWNLGTDFFFCQLVVGDEDKIEGYIIGEIGGFRRDVAYLSFLETNEDNAKELFGLFEKWVMDNGINKILYYSKNRRFAESHGYKFITNVCTKELNDGILR